ncbi:hypothetical protein ACFOTA_18690 [Chitinophaga sp. GCM10012297]|uniref:Uncharacterized protein n=1 Tax=Chitinophaga chungangae TaxID=2821488 RepID=A0ABS3YHT5_9BACT|nr:hypothetical protein [Chitinophaga chungangae]MBO9154250.1 hypothetical protein [Chitinophaga chungangae]
MSMYTYYFIAAIVALWLYRLAAYHFGSNDQKAKSQEARSSKRRAGRY